MEDDQRLILRAACELVDGAEKKSFEGADDVPASKVIVAHVDDEVVPAGDLRLVLEQRVPVARIESRM